MVSKEQGNKEVVPMRSSEMQVLIIDHKECDDAPIGKYLSNLGISVKKVSCPEIGKRALAKKNNYNAVITRVSLPGKSGSEIADWAKKNNVESPFFLLTERDWQLQDAMLNRYGITDTISDKSPIEEIHGKIISRFTLALAS